MPVTQAPFRRGEKVIATEPIGRVPEGTRGKVMLVNGFSWTRYWVHFDDGTEVGSIDQAKLVRAKEWSDFLVERENADDVAAADDGGSGDGAGGDDGAAAGGGDDATVNGVAIPAFLLERSRNARARLGG